MTKYYYKKRKQRNARFFLRFIGFFISLGGFLGVLYIFFPLLSWQIYFVPIFASQNVEVPIPKTTVVSTTSIKSLLSERMRTLTGVDYTDAQNWFPGLKLPQGAKAPTVESYNLSIPSLGITNAHVSTTDYNLTKHLINYPGTAIPSKKGNSVIFGHSTLPQLFNPNDYKSIFATLYKAKVGDEVFITVSNVSYAYKIYQIAVVDPSDTTIFAQAYDTSYLTLVTCTPPGTTWKRLIVKARLVPI